MKCMEKGHDTIGRLVGASLLQTADDEAREVKMHATTRSMALWVASECGNVKNRWLVQSRTGLKQVPDLSKWGGAERISLACNEISQFRAQCNDFPRSISLMLNNNAPMQSLCPCLSLAMRSLRVLSLSYTSLEELPPEIGELIDLQYLDLSATRLKRLPEQLGNLSKLRSLDLSHMPTLQFIPKSMVAKLSTSLRVLGMWCSYPYWEKSEAMGGVSFQELKDLEQIKLLELSVATAETLHWLSNSYGLARSMHGLALLNVSKGTIHLPSDLGMHMKSLRHLKVCVYNNVEKMMIDSSEWSSLPNLEYLHLQGLSTAEIIWSGVLPRGFPESLVTLEVHSCPNIEQLIGEVAEKGEGEDCAQ